MHCTGRASGTRHPALAKPVASDAECEMFGCWCQIMDHISNIHSKKDGIPPARNPGARVAQVWSREQRVRGTLDGLAQSYPENRSYHDRNQAAKVATACAWAHQGQHWRHYNRWVNEFLLSLLAIWKRRSIDHRFSWAGSTFLC